MKRFGLIWKRIVATALAALITVSAGGAVSASGSELPQPLDVTALNQMGTAAATTNEAKADEVRAIWISFLDLSPLMKGKNESQFTASIQQMFKTCADNGLNRVIVQVRPYGDSFYPSDYFPWSDYASGTMGTALSYDPLKIMVNEAHRLGLAIEAWVNPMRAMTTTQIAQVSDQYPIRRWYNSAEKTAQNLFIVSGRIYLNPASKEVRDLIAAGVTEIVRKYDVDGVHIDDYFYPSGLDFSYDASQYAAYTAAGGTLSQADWRRENTSAMVKQMYNAVKAADSSAVFGVSPRGVNQQTYDLLYADVEKWVQNPGYLDYVAPQIYYGFQNASAGYEKILKQWEDMVTCPDVSLLVGLAAYKSGTVDQYAGEAGKNEWLNSTDIIARQIDMARGVDSCDGIILFRYEQIFGSPNASMEKEKKNFIALLK